jgi:hypothetical protein
VTALSAGTAVNTGTVSTTTTESNTNNNSDSEETVIVEPPAESGTIVVQKEVEPDDSSETFAFTGALTAELGDGQSASAVVDAGTYEVSEVFEEDWELTGIECTDSDDAGTASSGLVGFATAQFHVEPGETVTCVFTNVEVEVLGEPPVGPGPDGPDGPVGDGPDDRPATQGSRVLPFTGWTANGLPQAAIIMILLGLALLDVVRRRRARELDEIG